MVFNVHSFPSWLRQHLPFSQSHNDTWKVLARQVEESRKCVLLKNVTKTKLCGSILESAILSPSTKPLLKKSNALPLLEVYYNGSVDEDIEICLRNVTQDFVLLKNIWTSSQIVILYFSVTLKI